MTSLENNNLTKKQIEELIANVESELKKLEEEETNLTIQNNEDELKMSQNRLIIEGILKASKLNNYYIVLQNIIATYQKDISGIKLIVEKEELKGEREQRKTSTELPMKGLLGRLIKLASDKLPEVLPISNDDEITKFTDWHIAFIGEEVMINTIKVLSSAEFFDAFALSPVTKDNDILSTFNEIFTRAKELRNCHYNLNDKSYCMKLLNFIILINSTPSLDFVSKIKDEANKIPKEDITEDNITKLKKESDSLFNRISARNRKKDVEIEEARRELQDRKKLFESLDQYSEEEASDEKQDQPKTI